MKFKANAVAACMSALAALPVAAPPSIEAMNGALANPPLVPLHALHDFPDPGGC